MTMGKSLMGRGILSDQAKKLSDVITRVQKTDAVVKIQLDKNIETVYNNIKKEKK